MDLHVIEPNGEEAYYGHRETVMGGMVSRCALRLSDHECYFLVFPSDESHVNLWCRDFRNGYGPEEYMLKKAFPGDYRMTTNYFGGSVSSSLTGPTTLLLSIFTNYGRPNQAPLLFLLLLVIRLQLITVAL